MSQSPPTLCCPICQSPLDLGPDGESPSPATMKLMPFCSARCQMVDLSNWLGERYTVPGEAVEQQAAEQPET